MFKKGDRVKLSEEARMQDIHSQTFDRLGTITSVNGNYIGVRRDGTKSSTQYHKVFWTVVGKKPKNRRPAVSGEGK